MNTYQLAIAFAAHLLCALHLQTSHDKPCDVTENKWFFKPILIFAQLTFEWQMCLLFNDQKSSLYTFSFQFILI